MATTVDTGIARHASAQLRHVVMVPSRYMMKKPSVAATPAHAVRIPLMDGWL